MSKYLLLENYILYDNILSEHFGVICFNHAVMECALYTLVQVSIEMRHTRFTIGIGESLSAFADISVHCIVACPAILARIALAFVYF